LLERKKDSEVSTFYLAAGWSKEYSLG